MTIIKTEGLSPQPTIHTTRRTAMHAPARVALDDAIAHMLPDRSWFHLPDAPRYVPVPNAALDQGVLGALGESGRTTFFVYILLRDAEATPDVGGAGPTLTIPPGTSDMARRLGLAPSTIRRHVRRLADWGWVERKGHRVVLGKSEPAGTPHFYFDAWLMHLGTRPTTGMREMSRRVSRVQEALKTAIDWTSSDWRRLLETTSPLRAHYVLVNLADPLLATHQGRGALLWAMCVHRFCFLIGTMGPRQAEVRSATLSQRFAARVLGVHEDTVRAWAKLSASSRRTASIPRGPHKRNLSAIWIPNLKSYWFETNAREAARIAQRSGSSQAALELLRSLRATRPKAGSR